MTIKPGDQLPNASFRVITSDGPKKMTTDEFFKGKKIVLVGMPGAFTPTCHKNHLPGYIEQAGKFLEKGIDTVAVTTTNDPFVVSAWAKASGGDGKVVFISDGNGELAKALGLTFDASEHGLGAVRSKRYSMLVEDRKVKVLNIEDSPAKAEATKADNLLKEI